MVVNQNGVKITQPGRIAYVRALFVPRPKLGQFERVLRLNPASYKALDNLGLCYEARGENDKAVGYFLSSIKLVEKKRGQRWLKNRRNAWDAL